MRCGREGGARGRARLYPHPRSPSSRPWEAHLVPSPASVPSGLPWGLTVECVQCSRVQISEQFPPKELFIRCRKDFFLAVRKAVWFSWWKALGCEWGWASRRSFCSGRGSSPGADSAGCPRGRPSSAASPTLWGTARLWGPGFSPRLPFPSSQNLVRAAGSPGASSKTVCLALLLPPPLSWPTGDSE